MRCWLTSTYFGPLSILSCLLAVVLFGIPLLIFCILDRSHTVYTLTNKRVIRKRGIVGKSTSEVDLRDIRNTQVNYGVIDRLLGFGSVAVGTAAHAGIEVTFAGIRDPEHVAQLIAEAKEMAR